MTASICDVETAVDQDETGAERRRRRLVEENYDLLYRQHARPLFRYLLRLTLGDYREAEDYLQETFLRTWRYLQEHTVDPKIMRQWLYTVARRIVIDGLRAKRARPTEVAATDLNLPSQPDCAIERLVQVHALRSALMSLSPEHRAALIEIFYHERTAREAAEILGVPEGTVKSRAYYAVRALRQAALAQDVEGHGNHRPAAVAGRRSDRPASARQPAAKDTPKDTPKSTPKNRRHSADSPSGVPVAA
jgi:RNA polymerase sigma-70 factor (ECF subfamily)